MNGFGSYSKYNIDEIIKKLEKQISNIKIDYSRDVVVLKNQLSSCAAELEQLKIIVNHVDEYTQQEYNKLNEKLNYLNDEIEDIKTKLNTIQYNEILGGKCASGINEFPIYARYAEKDTNGNIIPDYYAAKSDLSSVSSTLSADYTQKIADSSSAGMSALSSVSGQLVERIENEALERQSKDQELDGAISNESTARTAKDSELEERITEEEITRESAISGLQNLLEQEVIDLTNVIETETDRATSAEDGLRNSLSQEIVDRANAITDLENTISSVSSDLSLTINDNYDTLTTNLEEEINRASNEENLLSAAINAEKNDREEAISALQETITNEIEVKINELSGTVETGFEQLNNVDTELSGHIDNVSAGVTALSNDLHTNYYTNTEVYNKSEVDEAIANFGGFEVHQSLEEITVKKPNVIYLIGPAGIEPDLYKEYIYNSTNDEFVLIGDTTVDLSNYYTKSEVDTIHNTNNLTVTYNDEIVTLSIG